MTGDERPLRAPARAIGGRRSHIGERAGAARREPAGHRAGYRAVAGERPRRGGHRRSPTGRGRSDAPREGPPLDRRARGRAYADRRPRRRGDQRHGQPSRLRQDHRRPRYQEPARGRALRRGYREREELSADDGDERLPFPSHRRRVSEEALDEIESALAARGYLAEIMPYEDRPGVRNVSTAGRRAPEYMQKSGPGSSRNRARFHRCGYALLVDDLGDRAGGAGVLAGAAGNAGVLVSDGGDAG